MTCTVSCDHLDTEMGVVASVLARTSRYGTRGQGSDTTERSLKDVSRGVWPLKSQREARSESAHL